MSFFSELEDNLGKYIEGFFKEGFFKGKFGGNVLQPIEIAKKLAREMRSQSRVGLNEVYVPNRFEIMLASKDYEVFLPIMERMVAEVTAYVKDKAKEKDYTMLGQVTVSFKEQSSVAQGQLLINSFFDEETETTQEQDDLGDTLNFTPLRSSATASSKSSEPHGILEIAAGSLRGKRFVITGSQAILGRDEICDICVSDNSISRRHAVISRRGHRFFIKDRSSTNGTYVNDTEIAEQEINHGDKIKTGNTVFIFKVD